MDGSWVDAINSEPETPASVALDHLNKSDDDPKNRAVPCTVVLTLTLDAFALANLACIFIFELFSSR